ncbi:MAG: restriction endonuclease [Candidatus Aenigmarchaeota archaeon]|nr:restriction endonuclease [Candidatus Aenigmarchaeota archaeon]
MVRVTKFDGTLQPFDRKKVINTCLKLHGNPEQASDVANHVEKDIFDGIKTKEVLRLIFKYMKGHRDEIKYHIDLRTAISLLRPKPDFEHFIGLILKDMGYAIEMNRFVRGQCVEHEVDVIAKNGNETAFVEVKHHVNPHIYVGMETFLEYWAAFEDVKNTKNNNYDFTSVTIASNAKVSDYSKKYAACKGINYIAWNSPANSMEKIVNEKKLYPITFIKNLDRNLQGRLGDAGIVTLKQVLETDMQKLKSITGVSQGKLEDVRTIASRILGV